jgi:hypothetical protein
MLNIQLGRRKISESVTLVVRHREAEQNALFYEFSLEKHAPPDDLLRSIARFTELDEARREPADFYSHLGRPSIAPALMIRMLIAGYCLGICSERRSSEEVHLPARARRQGARPLDLFKNRHGCFRGSDLFPGCSRPL